MDELKAEFEQVQQANFSLHFRFPTEAERASLRIVHRDMSKADQARVKRSRKSLQEIVQDLERGELFAEDLDADLLRRLRQVLGDDA